MKYTITFDDGIVYTSPDIRRKDPGWASEDGAKKTGIRELALKLPKVKKALVLKGFEAYNFFVEASQALGSKNGAKILAFCLCGRWQDHVVTYRIDMKTGKITKSISKDSEEYFGTPTRGWRMGLIGEKAESGLICLLQ